MPTPLEVPVLEVPPLRYAVDALEALGREELDAAVRS